MLNGYKTLLGAAIAAAPAIASLFGYDVAPGFTAEATEHVESLITLLGAAIALYGRMVATVPGWLTKKQQ